MFFKMRGPKKGLLVDRSRFVDLFAAGVLRHGFGSFADGVLGEFTRQEKSDSGLDFPRRNGLLLVLERQS